MAAPFDPVATQHVAGASTPAGWCLLRPFPQVAPVESEAAAGTIRVMNVTSDPTPPWRPILACSLFAISVEALVASIVLSVFLVTSQPDDSRLAIPAALGMLAMGVIGALIAARTGKRDRGWIFLTIPVTFWVSQLAQDLADYGLPRGEQYGRFMYWLAKYAGASSATVSLSQADGTLTFAVYDDGVGFQLADAGGGTGLQGMADRLDVIGGSLEIRSNPGEGTTVLGRVPVN